MSSFIVRSAEPGDRPRWEALWIGYQAGHEIAAEITETTWRRFFDGLEPMHVLVAEQDGALIGFAHYLFHRSTAQLGCVCYLQDMFTLEAERGRGVGRAMIDAVVLRARDAGASRVYWNTGATNTVARGLYDKVASLTRFVQYRKAV